MIRKTRLAILASHPIQYNAPAFRLLAHRPRLETRVFYGWRGPAGGIDREFGRPVEWDIPLLDGYEHEFLENRSANPGTHHFRGISCPTAADRILRWNPDAVLVYGWAFSSHLRLMRKLSGAVPILFRGDSTLASQRSMLRRVGRRIALTWVYRHVDIALAAGTRNREYFLAHGVAPDRIIVAPHAVDNERFAINASSREREALEWRRALGIGDSSTVFLFAGKLSPVKDPQVLIAALRKLHQDVSVEAHLIICGDGELAPSLKVAATGMKTVHFVGFQNQSAMPTVYRLGNVTILPSVSETWGLAVNESMACGRPVISSDRVGCAIDLIEEGETGLVFPARNSSALAHVMRQLASDRSLTALMGKKAASRISAWSLSAYADGIGHALATVRHDNRSSDPHSEDDNITAQV